MSPAASTRKQHFHILFLTSALHPCGQNDSPVSIFQNVQSSPIGNGLAPSVAELGYVAEIVDVDQFLINVQAASPTFVPALLIRIATFFGGALAAVARQTIQRMPAAHLINSQAMFWNLNAFGFAHIPEYCFKLVRIRICLTVDP